MTTIDRNTSVFDLLDRGRIAHNGSVYANKQGDARAVKELSTKARALLQDAQAVDPTHEAPGWAKYIKDHPEDFSTG